MTEHPRRAEPFPADTAPAVAAAPAGGITRLLRVRFGWIVAVTLLATVSAGAFSLSQTPIYESTARVVVLPEVKPAGPAPQPPSMGTEKELVGSDVVASGAARALGVSVAELLDGLTVTVPVDTQVLAISYRSSSPSQAQRRAQAFANAYVAYKDSQPIITLPERARVITPAQLPGWPSRPNIPLNVAAGLIVGLLLGFLAALLRDRLDDRVRGASELEDRGLPVLTVLPPTGPASDLAILHAQDSPVARAYTALGQQVLHGLLDARKGQDATVVMTSVGPDERTSSVSVNLAAALAISGGRVAIVDARRRPERTRGEAEATDDPPGLVEVLTAGAQLTAVLQPTRVPQLSLLETGSRTSGATDQLIGPRWPETSAALSRSFDVVVISAAPILDSPDAVRLAHGAAGVVVIVHDGRSTRSELDRVVLEAGRLGTAVLGFVLIERARGWQRLRAHLRWLQSKHRPADADRDLALWAALRPAQLPAAPQNGQRQLKPVTRTSDSGH